MIEKEDKTLSNVIHPYKVHVFLNEEYLPKMLVIKIKENGLSIKYQFKKDKPIYRVNGSIDRDTKMICFTLKKNNKTYEFKVTIVNQVIMGSVTVYEGSEELITYSLEKQINCRGSELNGGYFSD